MFFSPCLLLRALLFSIVPMSQCEQECITVGCVPSAAVAVGGMSALGGVCLWGCPPRECVCLGVSAWGVSARGEVVYPGGVYPVGVSAQGDVSQHALGRGLSAPVHAGMHNPSSPVDRILDTCL